MVLAVAGLYVALRSGSPSTIAAIGAACGIILVGTVLSIRTPLSTQWTRDPDPAVEALYDDLDRLQLENRRLRRQVEVSSEGKQKAAAQEFDRMRAELDETRQELEVARREGSTGPDEEPADRTQQDGEAEQLREALERSQFQLDELRASIEADDVDPIALDEQVWELRAEARKAQADRALLREALQSSEKELQRAREAVRAYETDEPSDLDDRIRELQIALRRSEGERALLRSGRPESVWEARVGELERQLQGAKARAAALGPWPEDPKRLCPGSSTPSLNGSGPKIVRTRPSSAHWVWNSARGSCLERSAHASRRPRKASGRRSRVSSSVCSVSSRIRPPSFMMPRSGRQQPKRDRWGIASGLSRRWTRRR